MNKNFVIISSLLILLFSCESKEKEIVEKSPKTSEQQIYKSDSLISLLNQNKQFLKDSLLRDYPEIIDYYFFNYQSDPCGIVNHKTSELKEWFEWIKILKGVKKNKKNDTVFVMPSFNYCDDGDAYNFFDKTLPRLQTDSYCCHPENLFVIDDIDEDQINEIGIFYSSCTSRYKSLRIYTLKQNSWKEIGISIFDIQTQDPTEVKFTDLVRKISKNKFQICNFDEGQIKWETFKM